MIAKESPIGFFDSGVGGLSVYSKFKKILPKENTLYFGDLAHLPYGNKSKEELIGYARKILDFYKSKEVKAVVIACNTSSAKAYNVIKDEYDFKIYPIIQSCAQVIASGKVNRIGVFATEGTVSTGVYTKELTRHNSITVKEIACPNWVNIVENCAYTDSSALDDIRKHLIEMAEFKPEEIILGCTHYPYLLPILQRIAPNFKFIDPAEIFVNFIKSDLNLLLNTDNSKGYEHIFVSANPEGFVKNSKIFYKISTLPTLINL